MQWAVEGGLPFLARLLWLAGMMRPAAWKSVWGIGLVPLWVHCPVDYRWFFALLGLLAAGDPEGSPAWTPAPPGFVVLSNTD